MSLGQLTADFRQRQVRLVGDQRQHGYPMLGQPRATIASHGPSLGVALNRCAHRMAVLSLMLNRFAAARADEPPEIAEATRSRRS